MIPSIYNHPELKLIFDHLLSKGYSIEKESNSGSVYLFGDLGEIRISNHSVSSIHGASLVRGDLELIYSGIDWQDGSIYGWQYYMQGRVCEMNNENELSFDEGDEMTTRELIDLINSLKH